MNVFWLLSTLLLWNALVVVRSNQTPWVIEMGSCESSGEDLYSLFEVMESFACKENATLTRVYENPWPNCTTTGFEVLPAEYDRFNVELKSGSLGDNKFEVEYQLKQRNGPVKFLVQMCGTCVA